MNAPGDIYIIQEQYVFQPFNQLRNICNSNSMSQLYQSNMQYFQ